MPPVELVPHGPPARAALAEAVARAKGGDPFGPVTVAVPSTLTGLALRRALVTPGHGLLNVRFLALARVAELLGAPKLAAAGRRPLTDALAAEAVRAALRADPGELAAVAAHPATVGSAVSTLRDLRRAAPGTLEVLDRMGGLAATMARLCRATRDRTREFYDEEDLLVAAARVVHDATPGSAAASTLTELGHVVLFLPRRTSPGTDALLAALAERGALHAILGLTGDDAADRATRDLAAGLARAAGPAASDPVDRSGSHLEPPVGTAILHAPDPEDEVRAVRRALVTRAAHGTPLHRIAILFRNAEPYVRLTRELLDAGGIAWNGPSPHRLADTIAGRVLLGLVRLVAADFAREAVAAWLATGPVLDPRDGRPVPSSRFDRLSREAGVVSGLAEWTTRLARHRERLQEELTELARDDGPEAARRTREADLETLDRLARFVADLGRHARPPAARTWSARSRWARRLLDQYLGSEGRRRDWPEAELEAARDVEAALGGLATLDAMRAPVDDRSFALAIESALEAPARRVGRYGAGVFVGPLRTAVGADFDTVFVVGTAEGSFPPRGRDDPLLPDDRPGSRARARDVEERQDYLAALAAAPERVLCFPRADPRAQRKRLPARLLLATAARLDGVDVLGAEDLLHLPGRRWLTSVPSFEAGIARADEPGSPTEYDVRMMLDWRRNGGRAHAHPLASVDPVLASGFAATAGRAGHALGPFDGHVGPEPGLLPAPPRAVSPTALQDWAECPFRYLVGRVLRLREVPRPEGIDTISARERGALIHRVLEEFLRTSKPRSSPDEPWDVDDRARLLELASRVCDAAQARGATGRPLLWKLERRRILRELAAFLDLDERFRADEGVLSHPDELELVFGGVGEATAVDVEVPNGALVRFRGRIDRLDRAPDGSRAVVVDYKTGRLRSEHEELEFDPVAGGRLLQLPVYALAACRLTGARDVAAYYWFTAEPTAPWHGGRLTGATRDRLAEVVGAIAGGVTEGIFPMHPGDARSDASGRDTFTNCAYCSYDRLCPTDRGELWERKRDDPATVRFRALAEPEVLEQEREAAR